MRRSFAPALLCCLLAAAQVQAQTTDAKAAKPAKAASKGKGKTTPAAPSTAAPAAAAEGTSAAPDASAAQSAQAPAQAGSAQQQGAPSAASIDPEEFRRQVMEEVRRELQKTRDEVKQETGWIEADSSARVHDSEAVEALRKRVNLLQAHGYFRTRYEFFNNLDLGRGADAGGYTLFPRPFIGATDENHSISGANLRFRFEPSLVISDDLSIHAQLDMLDNVLLGSDLAADPYLSPYTPLAALTSGRAGSPVKVKRLWGQVNTQLGQFVVGRMGYHWGLGILHNDGNCLDCDYGDTYDRVAFTPRDFKGHKFTVMMDILDKGATTTGQHGELGRSVDVDTLDDGYRVAVEVVKQDTPDQAKTKLDAGEWVVGYGLVLDYRTQAWDTPAGGVTGAGEQPAATLGEYGILRQGVIQRKAKIYQPDLFLSLRKNKFRLDLEVASTLGSTGTRATVDADTSNVDFGRGLSFFQWGGALQAEWALLPADALLLGVETGMASGDKGVYGFGARPWRSGSTPAGTNNAGVISGAGTPNEFRVTAPGDIDGPHFSRYKSVINNFVFNRAFNVDMILFRNLVTAVTSSWYVKPSLRYRPTGRKSGGGDDSGFELIGSLMYAQTWYAENAPGLEKPLGLEANLGITYDTSDKLHTSLQYGVLLPFGGLKNVGNSALGVLGKDAGLAHAIRATIAIPF